ncbi:MAG: HAMP domain-containing histidine kinase [Saprospiraceae bacterium]|nr:HAMP domain-containing histidine kinase [Saprospiraceae bacterium]
MKLLDRTGLDFLMISIVAIALISLLLAFAIRVAVDNEIKNDLIEARVVLKERFSEDVELPKEIRAIDEIIEMVPVDTIDFQEAFQDTLLMMLDFEDDKPVLDREAYVQYRYTENINGRFYRVTLSHPKFETDDLLLICMTFGLLFLAILIVVLNLSNRIAAQSRWLPFHQMLEQIRKFRVTEPSIFDLQESDIDEFSDLREAILEMSNKISRDYHALKEFTDNAAHEMQTPVAIIQSQLDIMVQRDLNASSALYLSKMQHQLSKLKDLHQSLLLLSRLKSDQFIEREWLRVHAILAEEIEELKPLWESKGIALEKRIVDCQVQANARLLEIMISNLLLNAIKHNCLDGRILLDCQTDRLVIQNDGPSLKVSPDALFEKFAKSDQSTASNGLGLAIVKEVCTFHEWSLHYSEENQWHQVSIIF